MLINIQDDLIRLHAAGLLTRLLADKTTGRNIMWATDVYAEHGTRYERNEQIMPELITGTNTGIIKTRARKAFEQQTERTRRRAEVFTPLWICRKMTEHYYTECVREQDADKLINSRQLEITCGEAPFLVSRYDTTTGELIPIPERIGLLDRKLRIVNETAIDEQEWLKLSKRAFESTYGYEFQGDNLLIARVNLIETFAEYMRDRWQREPTVAEMRPIINIITWNVWQMDGLSGKIPYKTADEDNVQLSFFEEEIKAEQPLCRIFDWRARRGLEYNSISEGSSKMKFDFVIGNPPYQEENDNSVRKSPIYNFFMDEAYQISDVTELITPARFLFNAGQTPKSWNEKMLNDEHFKVILYEKDATSVFPNTDIKGGIIISVRDSKKDFGKISIFTPYDELNHIYSKVKSTTNTFLDSIVSARGMYRLTEKFFSDFPDAPSRVGIGTGNMIVSNIFQKIPEAFLTNLPNDEYEYIRVFGRANNNREYRYIRKEYLISNEYIGKYKIFFPEANSSGKYGEVLTMPEIGVPNEGATDTFINIGLLNSEQEAKALLKYIMSKFLRALLGIKKATQHTPRSVWDTIPLQDFTPNSDIDWSKSIPEIDKQLYAKYGLTDDEITFIETHVKEMS